MNRHRFWYLVCNAIPDAYREVKWAFQRVFRGHDERVMWGLMDYLAEIIPDVERFCHSELNKSATPELNPKRYEIFTKTLVLIAKWNESKEKWDGGAVVAGELWGYIGSHVGYFWD